MKEQFRIETQPVADPANVVQGDRYRITVLEPAWSGWSRATTASSRTARRRPSLHRAFAPIDFTVTETDHRLEIHTERLHC